MAAPESLALAQIRVRRNSEMVTPAAGVLFIFPCEGSGLYLSGKISGPLRRGDVLVAGAGSEVKLRASNVADFLVRIFSSSLENLYPCFGTTELSVLRPLSERLRCLKVYPAHTKAAAAAHRLLQEVPELIGLEHRAQLLRVASVFLNQEFQALQPAQNHNGPVEQRLVRYLETLRSDDLVSASVSDLAAKFGCSRRHLNRMFHHCFNVSVATLKMEIRLLKAVSLLRNPEAKIINIAEDCGFHHLGLFNTCFRKRFGVTPTDLRKGLAPARNHHSAWNPQVFLSMGLDTSLSEAPSEHVAK